MINMSISSDDRKMLLALFSDMTTVHLAFELYENPNRTAAELAKDLEIRRKLAFRRLCRLEDGGVVEHEWDHRRTPKQISYKIFKLTTRGRTIIDMLMSIFVTDE